MKISFNSVLYVFSNFIFINIACLQLFNNTGINLEDINFFKDNKHAFIGSIKTLNTGDKKLIAPELLENIKIDHLIIKFISDEKEPGITHVNKKLGGPVTSNGQITLEQVNAITFTGSPVSNLIATYKE